MSGAPATTEPCDDVPGKQAGTAEHLLGLVRALVVIGQELLDGLCRFGTEDLLARFSSANIALIVARVRRGLMIAAALEQRLVRHGHRLDGVSPRTRTEVARPRTPDLDKKRPERSRKPRFDAAADDAALLAGLPSAEEIARRLRRQPVGAVLADLCLDLGIDGRHVLWRELHKAILCHGGDLSHLLDAWRQRWRLRDAATPVETAVTPAQEAPPPAPPLVKHVWRADPSLRVRAWYRPPIMGTPPPAVQTA